MEQLSASLRSLGAKKEDVVRAIITKTPLLREFMCVHSVFEWDDKEDRDWFVSAVADEVVMSEKEVERFCNPPGEIPVEIAEKFSKFNLRRVAFEYHPIRIEYKFWGNPRLGESTDPVNIIYKYFEEGDIMKQKDVVSFIQKQGIIKL